MSRVQNPNLTILEAAVTQLGELVDQMVFVGGCATGLLLTDLAAPPIRATKDVDAIVEVASLIDYHKLSERLRCAGFGEDSSDEAPICRWIGGVVMLDVMPTDQSILGFGNRWYAPAFEQAIEFKLPSGKMIKSITAPYFLATKLAAFDGRGDGDYFSSHDLEDVIAVIDGRMEITEEVQTSDSVLRGHLAEKFQTLLRDPEFIAAVSGHLPSDAASQARVPIVTDRIKFIAES